MNRLVSKRSLIIQLIVVAFVMAFAATAIASSAGDGNGAVANSWSGKDWERVMNFTVLVVALFFAVRKPVSEALNNRIVSIKNQLEELEAKKIEAEKTLVEYEKKIATLDDEVEQILSQYREQGEAAKLRILEKAAASAEKMKEQAKRNIENEFSAAKQQLQAEMMTKALEKAEELIRKSISSEDQDNLIDDYLKKVVA